MKAKIAGACADGFEVMRPGSPGVSLTCRVLRLYDNSARDTLVALAELVGIPTTISEDGDTVAFSTVRTVYNLVEKPPSLMMAGPHGVLVLHTDDSVDIATYGPDISEAIKQIVSDKLGDAQSLITWS